MATRKPRSTQTIERTRDDALTTLYDVASACKDQQAIADLMGANAKTARSRSRAGTLKHADGEAVAPYRAKLEGAKPNRRVVEALVFTYAPQDDAALFTLADAHAPSNS